MTTDPYAELHRALTACAELDLSALPDAAVADAVSAWCSATAHLQRIGVALLARWGHTRAWEDDGASSPTQWLRTHGQLAGARRTLRVAGSLQRAPALRAALEVDELSYAHAAVIAPAAVGPHAEAFARDEGLLVEAARSLSIPQTERLMAMWRRVVENEVDPDIDPDEVRHQRRYLRLVETFDGMFHLEGLLDPETGAALAALIAELERRFHRQDVAEAQADGAPPIPADGGAHGGPSDPVGDGRPASRDGAASAAAGGPHDSVGDGLAGPAGGGLAGAGGGLAGPAGGGPHDSVGDGLAGPAGGGLAGPAGGGLAVPAGDGLAAAGGPHDSVGDGLAGPAGGGLADGPPGGDGQPGALLLLPDHRLGRTAPQRRADALAELLALWHSNAPLSGGPRATLHITASWEQLRAAAGHPVPEAGRRAAPAPLGGGPAPAHTDQGHRIPDAALAAAACDCVVHRILLTPDGVPLDVGREHRLATPAIRRALIRRDGGCAFPDCDRGHHWCDAHHIVPWEVGGPTSIENLVLLCRYHHTRMHGRRPFTCRIDGPDQHPRFFRPDGTVLVGAGGHRRWQPGARAEHPSDGPPSWGAAA